MKSESFEEPDPLGISEGARLYRVAQIANEARNLMESWDDVKEWLHEPQFALGDHAPLDMMASDAGAEQVEQLLVRIRYGVYT